MRHMESVRRLRNATDSNPFRIEFEKKKNKPTKIVIEQKHRTQVVRCGWWK